MVGRAMAMGKGELLMWTYNKMLQYPVNIKCTDVNLLKTLFLNMVDQMENWQHHLDIYLKDLVCQIKKLRLF